MKKMPVNPLVAAAGMSKKGGVKPPGYSRVPSPSAAPMMGMRAGKKMPNTLMSGMDSTTAGMSKTVGGGKSKSNTYGY